MSSETTEERRQADPEAIKRSLEVEDGMPATALVPPGSPVFATVWEVRGLRMVLRMAIKDGRIDLYRAGVPPYTYNVWDYATWARYEAHEWLARELAQE